MVTVGTVTGGMVRTVYIVAADILTADIVTTVYWCLFLSGYIILAETEVPSALDVDLTVGFFADGDVAGEIATGA